jgi:hypothetical protein
VVKLTGINLAAVVVPRWLSSHAIEGVLVDQSLENLEATAALFVLLYAES